MSFVEKDFLKFFGGIATVLICASIIGLVGMSNKAAVSDNRMANNEKAIQDLRTYYIEDNKLLRTDLKRLEDNQAIMQADIKVILKEVNTNYSNDFSANYKTQASNR